MSFGTTHRERVDMLKKDTIENVNGMWVTILTYGKEEAQQAFEAAAEEAGYELLISMLWRKAPREAALSETAAGRRFRGGS